MWDWHEPAADHLYWVERTTHGSTVREFTPGMPLVQAAGELGWSALREIGYDTLMLVEGPNDVPVYRALLGLYGLADRVFVMHLGGDAMRSPASLAELPGLMALAPHSCAVLDSERDLDGGDAAAARKAFKAAFDSNRPAVECVLLRRRSIENYFPQTALTGALGPGPQALRPFERLKDSKYSWSKTRNGDVASRMRSSDLAGTDLDVFFKALAEVLLDRPGGN